MYTTILMLGSNVGDRLYCLDIAIGLINSEIGEVVRRSLVYETEPWGYFDEFQYLNQVVVVDTLLEPIEILDKINTIEQELGRTRSKVRYAARTIDIDILFYDDCIMATPELTIPHAELANRRFVLEPLSEIAPELKHPVLEKTVGELLEACQDTCKVKQFF
ncbi:MAG: 2-amino-4-hydroxy-6-hydroxymethyldihydropteridine diphosphokinase [Bacteroidota bacterium]|nr:2-amino-4-hydroxy-6-hydroxymethyldihydropteridine diphosphokinase [Bacteroidota bacterium]